MDEGLGRLDQDQVLDVQQGAADPVIESAYLDQSPRALTQGIYAN